MPNSELTDFDVELHSQRSQRSREFWENTIKPALYRHRRQIAALLIGLLAIGAALFIVGTPSELRLVALNADNGRVRWAGKLGSRPDALGAPVARNGRVFISMEIKTSKSDLYPSRLWKLVALDTDQGKKLWEFIPDEERFGPLAVTMNRMYVPVATDDSVYVSIIAGRGKTWLAALDADSGSIRWAVEGLWFPPGDFGAFTDLLLEPVRYPMLFADNRRVYALFSDHSEPEAPIQLVALDTQTGSAVWQAALATTAENLSGTTPVIIANDQSVIVMVGEQAERYAAEDGKLQAPTPGGFVSFSGATLYTNSGEVLTATNALTGEQSWAHSWSKDILACVLFNADLQSVYAACLGQSETDGQGSTLIALNAQSGAERWRRPIAENFFTTLAQSPLIGSDKVFIVGGPLSGEIVMALSQADGAQRWTYLIRDGINLVAVDGKQVYVVDQAPRWRNWLAF